ncbi:restriction endonuclease [Massilia sp. PAMC28688]|uniref:restriction endonuclease n=1 Tax=Massilia sp. PAMC28688 TaxID=2861283 RepID=UPI001C63532A|nr:restriction endonuclease [Massilia sp. PAMC28688]QYF92537.1 restriction endonuclease [Massilia sp. PAMC28688]
MNPLEKFIAFVAAVCIVSVASGSPSVAVVVLMIVGVFVWFGLVGQSKRREERQRRIEEHIVELARKRQQLCFNAGYGVTDKSRWNKEMRAFMRNVLQFPTAGKQMQPQVEAIMVEIDEMVLAHIAEAGPTTGYEPDMSGTDYEAFCAELLRGLGFDAELTRTTGDQGADILASRNGERFAIQCKRYSGSVGNAAVQEAITARSFYDADHAVVVSNAQYTIAARQLAGKVGVYLLHHDDLSSLMARPPTSI